MGKFVPGQASRSACESGKTGKVCCVLDCRQRGTAKNVSYHKVPSIENMARRSLWLKTIRRRDYLYNAVNYIYVCSKHFKPEDFEFVGPSSRRFLKPGAVPSQFDWDFTNSTTICAPKEVKNEVEDVDADEPFAPLTHLETEVDQVPIDNVQLETNHDNDNDQPIVTLNVLEPQIVKNCDCSSVINELEEKIKELRRTVERQKQIIDIKDFRLKKAEKDLRKLKNDLEAAAKREGEKSCEVILGI